ncbi:MAG: PSD1 and planctomycete cytochrome C domain-containing protein [Mariniblastus sp.]|nr:PSD1 and planctomycete cytochrome C domain-containing protein [Mariniblastus sp.]
MRNDDLNRLAGWTKNQTIWAPHFPCIYLLAATFCFAFHLEPSAMAAPQSSKSKISYNRDVRPILSENCFACHGLDAENRQADLRLDLAETAHGKTGDAAAIVPGRPADSPLWQRVATDDPDEIMPPADSHRKLTAAQKETLRLWIEQGALYQKHWAFERPAKPVGDGIDFFVEGSLADEDTAFSPEADRPTLIRRVSFALTGLPPTIAEVDAFLHDDSDTAYEAMVDRYLASPRYGEEMARHWLDVARYGDTHGMHLDNERQMWAYRDWVVDAFNRNLGYDQFTIDQLAGDLVPNPTQNQLIATGFNRCNVTTGEGGSIKQEFIFRYAVDRASTTAQAWLGLTAGCAVCHDHKYDPISQKEFYSLYAFFNSNADPAMDGNALLTQPVIKVMPEDYEGKMKRFAERETTLREAIEKRAATIAYTDPAERQPRPPIEQTESVWFDDAFPVGAQVNAPGPVLVDQPVHSGRKSLKVVGPGLAQTFYDKGAPPLTGPDQGRFFLNVFLDPQDPPEEIMVQFLTQTWNHRAIWGADLIDWGKPNSIERFSAGQLPATGKWVKLEFDAADVGLGADTPVKGFAFTVHGGTAYFDQLGVVGQTDPVKEPRLSLTAWLQSRAGQETPGAPAELNAWLKAGPKAERTPEELTRLRNYYVSHICQSTSESFDQLKSELAAVSKERTTYDQSVPSTFVFRDLPQPRDSFVMIRGEYDAPGDPVTPGTPAVLPPLQPTGQRANRLDLAEWLVAPENPLTSRVAVNRFWQQIFGVGLVETSHDFGTQGSLPTHPELLDWLAVWFQQNDWDVKQLMRLMVTSQTFRQQSSAATERWNADPNNQQLARGPRFRLDAEQLRDQTLFVSGLMVDDMGGKGVNPYQPPNIWEPLGFGNSNTRYYKQGNGKALYRRTLYTFLKRTAPHPMLENFDAPPREQSCIRRDRTNTPLQALQLLNDVQHFEAARAFAQRIMQAAESSEDRIDFAYRTLLARHPAQEETEILIDFLDRQRQKYESAPEAASQAIHFGDSKPPADIPPVELAAWTLLANLMLNLDEVIVRN